MKIYTKKGDEGNTFLASGKSVKKNHPKVQLYGKCDELNSLIGLVASIAEEKYLQIREIQNIRDDLLYIQSLLFEYSAEIAEYYKYKDRSIFQEDDVVFLETRIDAMSEILPPLKTFILPGGSSFSSYIHLCRTKCREIEREFVAVLEIDPSLNTGFLKFFNRLSDYFFVLARYSNYVLNIPERNWKSVRKHP